MTEEEKKEYEELKSLLYTGQISQYGKRKLIDIIEKQDTEINKLNEKISKAIGHIEACKTTLGNYILSPNETECLLNILSEERREEI